MKGVRSLIAKKRIRALLAILQVVVLVLTSITFATQRTPPGIHCPTAPVQLVREVSALKVCCVVRAPKLGEKDFKQCFCAEKKASKQEVEKDIFVSGGYRFVFVATNSTVSYPNSTKVALSRHPLIETSLIDRNSEPIIPPPNFI